MAGGKASSSGSRFKAMATALFALAAVFFAVYFIVQGWSNGIPKEPLVRQFPVMGTICELKFWDKPEQAAKAADVASDAIREVESRCSVFDKASELSALNASAFDAPFKCSPELWELLSHSRRFNAVTDGNFDITIRPLMVLWGFSKKRGELPSKAEIETAMQTVGMDKLIFDDNAHTVKFAVKGMALDLGGIAKGYALDKAAEGVLALGVKRGIINLGGNMRCLPLPPPGRDAYAIGIRNPFDSSATIGTIKLLNCCVGTSGDYERYVVINGRHYTHIMNSKTGLPVENMLSVTVVTPLGVESDGLSKGPFVGGSSYAKLIAERIPATSVLVIRRDPADSSKALVEKFGSIWGQVEAPQPPLAPKK